MSKILIIEDEESIAELERDYLEISSYEVTICNDGEKGLKEALMALKSARLSETRRIHLS